MIKFANGLMMLIAILLIISLGFFQNHLSGRGLTTSNSVYSVPFSTHGGTVYVSKTENVIVIGGWAALISLGIINRILDARMKKK